MKKIGTFKPKEFKVDRRDWKEYKVFKKWYTNILKGYKKIMSYNSEDAVKDIHEKDKKLLLEESIHGTTTFYEITKKEVT